MAAAIGAQAGLDLSCSARAALLWPVAREAIAAQAGRLGGLQLAVAPVTRPNPPPHLSMQEVTPQLSELDHVLSAGDVMTSVARTNYSMRLEAAVNEQIK